MWTWMILRRIIIFEWEILNCYDSESQSTLFWESFRFYFLLVVCWTEPWGSSHHSVWLAQPYSSCNLSVSHCAVLTIRAISWVSRGYLDWLSIWGTDRSIESSDDGDHDTFLWDSGRLCWLQSMHFSSRFQLGWVSVRFHTWSMSQYCSFTKMCVVFK